MTNLSRNKKVATLTLAVTMILVVSGLGGCTDQQLVSIAARTTADDCQSGYKNFCQDDQERTEVTEPVAVLTYESAAALAKPVSAALTPSQSSIPSRLSL